MHVLYLRSQETYGCLVPCFLYHSTILSCVRCAHICRIHVICSIFIFVYTHSISASGWMVFCSDANILGHNRYFPVVWHRLAWLPRQIYWRTNWGARLLVSMGSLGRSSLHAGRGDTTWGSGPLANEDVVTPSWLCLGKCDFHGWLLIHHHSWRQCKAHFPPLWSRCPDSVPAGFPVTL